MPMTAFAAPPSVPATGCRLVAADGRTLPLRAVDVRADAGGGLARVRLRQTFANPYAEPMAVTYLLPLPADGSVVDFAFVLGGRRVAGRVERRADARATFEQAVLEGRTAALLDQERSSLFTQELGNLPPGAELHLELDVEQPLRWTAGGWEWRWPTVIGPRWLGAPGETPDAPRITVDVADAPLPVTCTASVVVSDATTGPATSPSHALEQGEAGIGLAGALDRDLVVRWPVAAPAPGVRLEVAAPAGDPDAFGLLTLVPPAVPMAPVRRDLCLLLDTSGSMSGAPLAQLQAFATALVSGLRDGDHLELISFSSAPVRWRPDPVVIDVRTRHDATRWVAALRAGGGTAMHHAVTEALAPLSSRALRQVVLMTDGYIGMEQEVVGRIRRALPSGARIHTVGIGSSVNRTLTGGVARAGGGHEAIVGVDEPVTDAVAALLARTGDPLWVEVTVTGTAVREVAPAVIPDLLAGAPARVSVRLDPRGGTVVVTGRSAAGVVSHTQTVAAPAPGSGRRVLATRFARERAEDLETAVAGGEAPAVIDPQLEALGLRHRIATRLTSWVAVSEQETVDPGAPRHRRTMPHALPYGVSAEGVGLAPAPAPLFQPASLEASAMPRGGPPMAPADGPRRLSRAAPARPSLPAPAPARQRQEARKTTPVDFEGARRAPAVPEPLGASDEKTPALPELVARVVALADGRLVLEVTLDRDTDWMPEGVVVLDADGRALGTTPVAGTTRAGRVRAGMAVRLVLGWTGPLPREVRVSGRTLRVRA